MRLTRLTLRNYRVFEACELEVPPGLVGIYGPNGAGKSYLVESVLWTLFGKSRTTVADVRTTDVRGECSTEVEFEHEGHLYVVRRTLTGAKTTTVKASVLRDHQQMAEGGRDVAVYVHRILGMDADAFTASVFAEQKQIAAFSDLRPEQRRKLVLDLLGISTVDVARDQARRDARDTAAQHQRLQEMLPDLQACEAELEAARAEATRQAVAAEASVAAREAAAVAAEEARAAHDALAAVAGRYEALVSEGKGARQRVERAARRIKELTAEMEALGKAADTVELLQPEVAGLEEAAARLHQAEDVVAARAARAQIVVPEEPPPPDEKALAAAREEEGEARQALAEVDGLRSAAIDARDRAEATFARSHELTGAESCPLCGQALGAAFAQVQSHWEAELRAAQQQLVHHEAAREKLVLRLKEATARVRQAEKEAKAAGAARLAWERASAQSEQATRRLATADAALSPPLGAGEIDSLRTEVVKKRAAREEIARLEGQLVRQVPATDELAREQAEHEEAERRRQDLLAELERLGFDPARRDAARAAWDKAQRDLEVHQQAVQQAAVAAAQAAQAVKGLDTRLGDARAQHEKLAALGDDARHRTRVAALLGSFRNTLVGTIGPRLSAHASELFAELTDREYDQLEVDAETYEIRIRDAGRAFGMGRFSGSETDLANLSLRVAISEHVRMQSGGEVGLLVLDEVFGMLDADRKARMLLALQRLQGRFRQVLVITHDADIKEELPHAIEVVKLPGRRAQARVVVA